MGMKIYEIRYTDIPELPASAAAIGYFDGFHKGHQQLIGKARQIAKEKGLQSALITFHPDPWTVFKPWANKDHLLTPADKQQLAQGFGVDLLYILHFDKAFAGLPIEDFHAILAAMNVKELVCGFDFTYGAKGLGSPRTLRQQTSFSVHEISSVNDLDWKISSTRIEKLLRAGLVSKANALLGYYYSIAGIVVHGYGRGSDVLQMPTANLQSEEGYVMVGKGVYAGYVLYNGTMYQAMINIGSNPTFGNDRVSIEANLLDFDKDLYGAMVRFFFCARIRPEIRFENPEALRAQLQTDRRLTPRWLKREKYLLGPTVDLWSLKGSFDILKQ